ncbi:MAG: M23 family metallopeptidase [Parcubacteria group bacterium]
MKYFLAIAVIAVGLSIGFWVVSQGDTTDNLAKPSISSEGTEKEFLPAVEPSLSIRPDSIIQGEPLLVSVQDLSPEEGVQSISFNNKKLDIFSLNSEPSVLVGIDLRMQTGTYPLVATLSTGEILRKDIRIAPRDIVVEDFDIPKKLGGNTPEAEKELINTLVQEAVIMNAIPSAREKLWDSAFRMPLSGEPEVTSVYGYSRSTVGSRLSHKGTDFRAPVGTPVYAMNSGVVRFKDSMRNYGNTVVIDHGLGLQTVYMHLSEMLVEEGQEVTKGQLIGKSGDTGYVLGPHLHLSVRINYISIDPMKFIEIFG